MYIVIDIDILKILWCCVLKIKFYKWVVIKIILMYVKFLLIVFNIKNLIKRILKFLLKVLFFLLKYILEKLIYFWCVSVYIYIYI